MRTSRLAPPPHAPARHPASLPKYSFPRTVQEINSRPSAGKVYPHEIDIQETHPKHRKLDSQAALSHRARGRAADGLRTQVWSLWPSRRAMILVAYRHGLRASEVCDLQWQQIELSEGRLHVHRVKNGISSVHPIRGDEIRGLRKLRRDYLNRPPHPARRRGCQDAFPDPPTHAAPCLRV